MVQQHPQGNNNNNNRSAGPESQFPGKLHDLLSYAEKQGLEHVISWVRDGCAFVVHRPAELVVILPLFFRQIKYRSFQRQLNMWHFVRASSSGPDQAAVAHPYFIRGQKSLCSFMSRAMKQTDPMKSQHREAPNISSSNFARLERTVALSQTSSNTASISPLSRYTSDVQKEIIATFAGPQFHSLGWGPRTLYSAQKPAGRPSLSKASSQQETPASSQKETTAVKSSCKTVESLLNDLKERKTFLLETQRVTKGHNISKDV
jgi:hypothetical protein